MATPDRINLTSAEVLLACGDAVGLDIMVEMFSGFGVHTPRRCPSGEQAQSMVRERIFNLIVVDAALSDMDGYDFVHWLRRSELAPNCYAPVILINGHTTPSQIFKGRDSGASFVVRKPVAPMVMMQRILWLLADKRQFVTSPGYCGPDRRVRSTGVPIGMKGRRHDDLSAELGEAVTPNLDQNEIDAMFKSKAIAL